MSIKTMLSTRKKQTFQYFIDMHFRSSFFPKKKKIKTSERSFQSNTSYILLQKLVKKCYRSLLAIEQRDYMKLQHTRVTHHASFSGK